MGIILSIKFQHTLYRRKMYINREGYTIHAFDDKRLKPINFKKKYREV